MKQTCHVASSNKEISISDHHGLSAVFEFQPRNSLSHLEDLAPLNLNASLDNADGTASTMSSCEEVCTSRPSQQVIPSSPRSRSSTNSTYVDIRSFVQHHHVIVPINSSDNAISVLDEVRSCLESGLLDAHKRYHMHKRRMIFIFVLMMLVAFADCFVQFSYSPDFSIMTKLFILVCGASVAIEFVLSQYFVKGEMRYHAAISKEVERMRLGLMFFVHDLNDSLSRIPNRDENTDE